MNGQIAKVNRTHFGGGEPKGSPIPPPFHLWEPKGSPHTPPLFHFMLFWGKPKNIHID
jgi:hypothetical protein